MDLISNICAILTVMAILATPVLMLLFIIRWCMRKKKLWFGIAAAICAGSIIPLAIIGTFTDSATYCEHEYSVVEEVAPTCANQGKIVKVCALCERENVEYIDKVPHAWETDTVISATCDNGGYIVERCTICADTKKTDTETALGHDMKEVSRTEPTYEIEGKVVTRCSRCGHEEIVVAEKLKREIVEFDDLELSFGQYTFTTVDNRFSDYYKKTVVKIPVTIKNVSDEPHRLSIFDYQLFGASGAESENISYYFDDDVSDGGDLLPGSSYIKYFHILYDGDGVYTILLDNWWYEEETVEIKVKK